MDIAGLAFTVDSSDTLKAVNALDNLRQTATAAGKSQQDFTQQSDYLSTSMAAQTGAAARLSRQLAEAGSSFEDLVVKAGNARKALDGSFGSFEAWDQAQQKVEALGRAYGTTARGLDAYLQTAASMSLSSTQAAAAAQRLTQALEGQTAAAAALRQILSNNGVSVGDLQSDQLDTLLTRIKGAFQKVPDTAQRTNDLRQVLGTFDPDVLGTFTRPNYVPILQVQQQQRVQAADVGLARQQTAVANDTRRIDTDRTEYADLRSTYRPFDTFTPEQEAQLRAQAPTTSALFRDGRSSYQGELEFYRSVRDAQLPSDMSKATPLEQAIANARQPQFSVLGLSFGLNGAAGAPVRALRYLNSGQVSTNDQDIENRFHDEADNDTSFLQLGGFPSRLGNMAVRSFQNQILGSYTPKASPPPPPNPLDQPALGAQLATFGDPTIQRYQQSQDALKSLGVFNGQGDTTAANRERTAREAFTTAYGAQDGAQNYDAALVRAKANQRSILDDTGDLDQANLGVGLSSMNIGDAGKARAFVAYARQRNVPVSALAGRSLPELLDPANSNEIGLPAGLLRTFNATYAANQTASGNEFDRNQAADLKDLGQQAGVTGASGTAVQDLTTYQQAYRKALAETSDAKEADRRASAELDKVDAQRLVTIKSMLSEQDRANTIEQQRVAVLGLGAGGYGGKADADRASLGYTAQIEADLSTTQNRTGRMSEQDQATFRGVQGQKLATQGLASAQDRTAATAQDLDVQQKMLAVAGERQSVQDKLNRDLQVERDYQADLAKAQAGPNNDAVDKIKAQIEEAKKLKDALAEVNAEAKLFTMGRDARQSTSDSRYLRSLPPEQRALQERLQPIDRLEHDAGGGGTPGTASSPDMNPTQRAFLDTIAGTESGGSYNRRYSPSGTATFSDFSRHPQVYEPGPAGPSSAAGRYMMTAQTWGEESSKLGLSDYGPANQDKSAWDVAATRYKAATGHDLMDVLQSGDQTAIAGVGKTLHGTWTSTNGNFASSFTRNLASGPTSTAAAAPGGGLSDAATDTRQAVIGQVDEERKSAIQRLGEQAGVRQRGVDVQTGFLARGETGNAAIARAGVYDPADPRGADVAQADATIKQKQALEDLRQQQIQAVAQSDLQTASNTRMAQAYGTSDKAVLDLQDRLKAEGEVRANTIKNVDEEARVRQIATQRISEQQAALEKQAASMRENNDNQKVLNDLGPMATDAQLGRAQAQLDIEAEQRKNPGADISSFANARTDQQNIKEQTDQVNQYKQAWSSAESAAMSSLNNVILNGGRATDVIGALAKSLANIGLNTLEKSAGNWLTGGLSGLFGGGGGAEAGGVNLSATGNAWVGGQRVRMFANGGLIDRPTYFATGGEVNLAGEVGTEAIMPLKRMPNGDLGVSTGSGGKGGSGAVTVNAPITINGSGGSGSSMSPQDTAALQMQLKEAVRQAVVAGIADERRAGGSLY